MYQNESYVKYNMGDSVPECFIPQFIRSKYDEDEYIRRHMNEEELSIFSWIRIYLRSNDNPYASCDECGRMRILYGFSIVPDKEDYAEYEYHSVKDLCFACVTLISVVRIKNRIYTHDGRVALEELWENVGLRGFIPDSEFPKPEGITVETCLCGSDVVTYTNESAIPERLRPVIALDTAGREHTLHKTCAMWCVECELYYVSPTWGVYRLENGTATSVEGVDFPIFNGMRTRCSTCVHDLVAEDDYSQCDTCGSYELVNTLTTSVEREAVLCEDCYNSPLICNDCEGYYKENEEHLCPEQHGSASIRYYSYKPKPKFFGADSYYLGFELEVESCERFSCGNCDYDEDCECGDDSPSDEHDDVLEKLHDRLGARVYYKEDGSLDNGFEIVSHPHSLAELQTNFDWSILNVLSDNNYVSWNNDNCGLHVHVSKTAFNKDANGERHAHEIRFNKFIYDNQELVERIAGRKSNHYSSFGDKGNIIAKVKHESQRNGRYEVVNVFNSATYEVRIFKGSLRKDRVLSGIEFVHAVVEHTRNMKVSPKHKPFSWTRFVQFVSQNQETYPHLETIISEMFTRELARMEK